MRHKNSHIPDEELLLAADGELSRRRRAAVDSHVAACWICRTRMKEIETALGDFIRRYNELEPRLPSIEDSRASFKARLAQLASESRRQPWKRARQSLLESRQWALATAGLIVIVSAVLVQWTMLSVRADSTPDADLTPGVAVSTTAQHLCAVEGADALHPVSPSLANEVFEQYGIRQPKPRSYEIDYLITPALGGANDIRNLWPQPYSAGTWNSRVKDALEDHLYRMVCENALDLETAQREIATNWIAAYKKYFHTETPLPAHEGFTKDPPWE